MRSFFELERKVDNKKTAELEKEFTELEFENVGVTAQLFVNGKDMGQRICRPYRWDITEAVKPGENDVEVFVCNTLAQRMQDFFSTYMTLPASGITGKVRLFVQ